MLCVLPGRLDAVTVLLECRGDAPTDNRCPMTLHEATDVLRNFLVEAPEEDGTGHHMRVVAKTSEEARTLQGDVAGAHDECFPGGRRQLEQVVRGYAELLVPGDAKIARTPTDGNHEVGSCECDSAPIALCGLNCVRSNEAAECVDVVHLLLAQLHAVAEVERTDVVLHLGG